MNRSTARAPEEESPAGTGTSAISAEARERTLQQQVRSVLIEDDLTQKKAATMIGIGEAVLNQWLQDKYNGSVDTINTKVTKWLRGRGERVSMAQLIPASPDFYQSETAQKIVTHLKLAHTMQDMLAVFGLPGVGKTSAIRYYQRGTVNVWVTTLSPAVTGVIPVLQEIAETLGSEGTGKGHGARRILSGINNKLRNTNGLLIIDEAHHMASAALDAVRSLHDSTGIAIALIGGPELQTKIQALPQFHSRLGLRLFVTQVLAKDIAALLDAWGISNREIRKYLTDLSKRPGALRGVTKVIKLASVMASGDSEPLDIKYVKDAAMTLSTQATGDE